tara:strand:- start:21297 stop:22373 length:1077 start_codon:yes stop_codon:yes gene_type:complete
MASVYTIEDIVDVNITLGDRPIAQSNFSTPLILTANAPFEGTSRIITVTGVDDMVAAGFADGDPAYEMVALIFSGDNPPREAIVGNVDTDNVTTPETYIDALAAVENETTDWFFILADTHLDTDIEAIAQYAEAERKMYITSSAAADIPAGTVGNLLETLKDLQYNNTMLWPHADADTVYPEGAVVGAMAGLREGSSTLHGKTLPGVPTNKWTRTQANYIKDNNGFQYVMIGGVGFALDGKMVSGRFFDVVRGALWLEANLESDLFGLMKRQSDLGRKISYDQVGLTVIEGVIYERLNLAVARNFLAASPAPTVIMPNIEDILDNDKANRELNMVQFQGVLAGAVHYMLPVRGFITLS